MPQALADGVGKARDPIGVKVAEVEHLKAAEALRQVGIGQTNLANDRSERIVLTTLTQTRQPQDDTE